MTSKVLIKSVGVEWRGVPCLLVPSLVVAGDCAVGWSLSRLGVGRPRSGVALTATTPPLKTMSGRGKGLPPCPPYWRAWMARVMRSLTSVSAEKFVEKGGEHVLAELQFRTHRSVFGAGGCSVP